MNTTDGSLMTALRITALHLRIVELKFTHNFIICDRLPDAELIFGINIQRKFSISYAWDKEKKLLHPKGWEISNISQKLQTEGNN